MISERELLAAINKFEEDPVTLSDCEKLAVYYTLYDHLFGGARYEEKYSTSPRAARTETNVVVLPISGSEFLNVVEGKEAQKVWEILDELVGTLKIINPRLYEGVIRRLEE